MPTVQGQPPVQQPTRYIWDVNNGNQEQQVWQGTKDQIEGLAAFLRATFERVEIAERAPGLWEAIASTSRPSQGQIEQPNIVIELRAEEQVYDLAFNGYFAGVPQAALSAIDEALQNPPTTTSEENDKLSEIATAAGAYSSQAQYLYRLKRRGQDSFVDYAWSCTKTNYVSRFYSGTINLSNHGKLWTNAQLSSYVGSPLFFVLPSTKSATADQSSLGLAYRWLQHQSDVNITSNGNFTLTEGWRLALWNTNTYAAAS